MGLNFINMSRVRSPACFLFGKIGEQKISGSEVAGYYGEQTVFRKDCFCCFLIVS